MLLIYVSRQTLSETINRLFYLFVSIHVNTYWQLHIKADYLMK